MARQDKGISTRKPKLLTVYKQQDIVMKQRNAWQIRRENQKSEADNKGRHSEDVCEGALWWMAVNCPW